MTEFISPQPDTILKNRYQLREQIGFNSRRILAWDLLVDWGASKTSVIPDIQTG